MVEVSDDHETVMVVVRAIMFINGEVQVGKLCKAMRDIGASEEFVRSVEDRAREGSEIVEKLMGTFGIGTTGKGSLS